MSKANFMGTCPGVCTKAGRKEDTQHVAIPHGFVTRLQSECCAPHEVKSEAPSKPGSDGDRGTPQMDDATGMGIQCTDK